MERCPARVRPAQDVVQPLCALEQERDIQPDFHGTGRKSRDAGAFDDRHHTPESAPHRRFLATKRAVPRCIGRTKGGLNSKLHAVCDGSGKPVALLLSEGQMSDYKGAARLLDSLLPAKALLADRGYAADWFRAALQAKGITPCIPPKKNRKFLIPYDTVLYKQRHKIENMFAKLKDWRRIATRYDRCAHTFFSAICIAATCIFYLF
jgi:transposase